VASGVVGFFVNRTIRPCTAVDQLERFKAVVVEQRLAVGGKVAFHSAIFLSSVAGRKLITIYACCSILLNPQGKGKTSATLRAGEMAPGLRFADPGLLIRQFFAPNIH
jgi:hypothetical protein